MVPNHSYVSIEHNPGGANIPRAWATSSIFQMIQAILAIRADAPHKRLYVHPTLPDWLPNVELQGLHIGPCTASLRFWRSRSHWEVIEVQADQGVAPEDIIQVEERPDLS